MNIETIKRRLLVKYPLFGSVVANSNFLSEITINTSDTDGKNICYNPNFLKTITEDEQLFVLAHEICHIAFNHIFRSKGKDIELWNIATDAVINAFLKQDGLTLIKGVVDIPEAINYDAEGFYKKLLEKKQQNKDDWQSNKDKTGKDKPSKDKSGNDKIDKDKIDKDKPGKDKTGQDTHSMWVKAIESEQQEKQAEENQEGELRELREINEKEVFKYNKIRRDKQLEELRASLASQSCGYGNAENGKRRNLTDVSNAEPITDWRRLLNETVKYDVDWSYQNAEVEDGVVTMYLEKISKPEVEIVLDTSDSVDDTLLRNFLRECKNILRIAIIKVGCFDTKFYGFTEIRSESDIDHLAFYGGGGTDFEVAVNAFTKRAENKIIFTDGDAAMPSTPLDAIWIVFGEKSINPVGGKVIYINGKQFERLCSYQATDEVKGKIKQLTL